MVCYDLQVGQVMAKHNLQIDIFLLPPFLCLMTERESCNVKIYCLIINFNFVVSHNALKFGEGIVETFICMKPGL